MASNPKKFAGLHTGGGAIETEQVSYIVVKDITNGMKIAGARRAKGEVFMALPRHMTFLLAEGVVALAETMAPEAQAASHT